MGGADRLRSGLLKRCWTGLTQVADTSNDEVYRQVISKLRQLPQGEAAYALMALAADMMEETLEYVREQRQTAQELLAIVNMLGDVIKTEIHRRRDG